MSDSRSACATGLPVHVLGAAPQVQAMRHGGYLPLEYRDRAADQYFQAREVTMAAVADALSQWMRGDRAFNTDHEWHQLRS